MGTGISSIQFIDLLIHLNEEIESKNFMLFMMDIVTRTAFNKIAILKCFLPVMLLTCAGLTVNAQENKAASDSAFHYPGLTKNECPREFLAYINNDSLQTKAVLLVLNESLHPLGRHEFFDNGIRVHFLRIPMRMNRCTLLYIDSGMHLFHTLYQRLKKPVNYQPGKIYIARLFSRTIWLLGGTSIIKKNEKGEQEEYAAVLFEYISASSASELYGRMKKKEVLVNE